MKGADDDIGRFLWHCKRALCCVARVVTIHAFMTATEHHSVYTPPPIHTIATPSSSSSSPPCISPPPPGQRALLVTGGRGGRGNASFKTARNTAPAIAEKGEAGEEAWVDLELKVVADVGIVGIPNAGKSTLLSVVSAARPKIANYPFTTLVPNLGVCEMDFRTTVFADVPGLLEGAHQGIGLGHEFLRHCQRCRLLVHVIDGSSRDPLGDWHAINTELELFNEALADKRQIIAYNKVDLPDSGDYFDDVVEWLTARGVAREDVFAVSAVTGQGVVDLVRRVRVVLDELPEEPLASVDAINATKARDTRSSDRLDEFTLEVDDSVEGAPVYVVSGAALERFTQMTNWDYYESLKRFQTILDASGVTKALRGAGVKEGDTVVIGDMEMEWSNDQSEGALFDRWENNQRAMGRPGKGMARWPHRGG